MDKQTFLSSYEKDGYQVIDSFIYDDIKTFLERNKPRKNHIIWIVFISGFFILFFIGFAMGKIFVPSTFMGKNLDRRNIIVSHHFLFRRFIYVILYEAIQTP